MFDIDKMRQTPLPTCFCNIMAVGLTYIMIIYTDYVLVHWFVEHTWLRKSIWGPLNIAFFNFSVLVMIVAHFRAAMADPGFVPIPGVMTYLLKPLQCGWSWCKKCKANHPPRANHCDECGRCVQRLDHHSIWINNCVGKQNQRYFIQFLFYMTAASMQLVTLFFITFDYKQIDVNTAYQREVFLKRFKHSYFTGVFSMFVTVLGTMWLIQLIDSIITDNTTYEQLNFKNPVRVKKTLRQLFREIFGRSPLGWFLPLKTNIIDEEFWLIDATV